MSALTIDGDARLRTATIDDARWLQKLQLWRPDANDLLTSGDGETAVILLNGTFDLTANHSAWPARGIRKSPFQGRPMAVFLPPNTKFKVDNGPDDHSGEILLIQAGQPKVEEAEGKQALSQKPLLPLAGSGKSFDPQTGEWKPAETFASNAESLPPRRFQKLQVGDVKIERIFAPDYKAKTLSVDEAIVPPGNALRIADIPELPFCDELLVFTRNESTGDDQVQHLPIEDARDFAIEASDAPVYAVITYAGKG